MPRTHGSALFTRGETQAIVTTTLGTSDDEQRIESLEGLQRERFMLHYNFPPFQLVKQDELGLAEEKLDMENLLGELLIPLYHLKKVFLILLELYLRLLNLMVHLLWQQYAEHH